MELRSWLKEAEDERAKLDSLVTLLKMLLGTGDKKAVVKYVTTKEIPRGYMQDSLGRVRRKHRRHKIYKKVSRVCAECGVTFHATARAKYCTKRECRRVDYRAIKRLKLSGDPSFQKALEKKPRGTVLIPGASR